METTPSKPRGDADLEVLPFWLLLILPAIAIALFVLVAKQYFDIFPWPIPSDTGKWGEFGDYVGGVLNPILSFFALIALLFTIRIQVKELKISTRELRKSAEAFEQQNFESTFFQLLRRVGWLAEATKMGNVTGREALKWIFLEHLKKEYYEPISKKSGNTADAAIKAYELLYQRHHDVLGHYFRTLYHLFTFVDKSRLTKQDKETYANIARAQLSTYELCLLFYNGASIHGAGFKSLIEKYGVLKHVYDEALFSPTDKSSNVLYHPSAFMGREDRERYYGADTSGR